MMLAILIQAAQFHSWAAVAMNTSSDDWNCSIIAAGDLGGKLTLGTQAHPFCHQ